MSDVTFRIDLFADTIKQELLVSSLYQDCKKDILIVVHNQLPYLIKCVESIRKNTDHYQIYLWNNNSDTETKNWIDAQQDIVCVHHPENIGFIIPNNKLIELGSGDFVILLNSDTEVLPSWDKAMISQIQTNNFAQVGYLGGILNTDGKGSVFRFGSEIDYLCGWCFCISRKIYEKYGLFDDVNLQFAYCEDSDFSLRLTENHEKIYALHLGLVTHHENKTIKAVMNHIDCKQSFLKNHNFIKKKWSHKFSEL